MTDASREMETLLIGIDAACESIVDPMIAEGKLPNLARVFDEGVSAPLESQIPPWTASAWPSIHTGVNPGKHGAFGFLSYEGYDWEVVDFDDVKELTIWEILTLHEKTSVVVNAPVTHPPSEFDGAIVPGYVAPEDPDTHPEGILDEYASEHGEYRVYPDHDADPLEEYPALVEMRGDAFCYLADEFEPAFGYVQIQVTDSIFHEHPDDEELLDAVYAEVDRQVGRLLERYDPETVMIVSDHGMGRYDDYEFRLNEFLREEGYLETRVGSAGMPAWIPILNDTLRDGEEQTESPEMNLSNRAINLAARVGLTPERAGAMLRALGMDEFVSSRLPDSAKRAGREEVDFPASSAYMRSRIELGIRVNREGREPEGVVSEADFDEVREALIDILSDVRTPDGDPVFEDVAKREEYFWGPHADEGVDVVTVPYKFDQFLSADLKGEVFGEPTEPWNHKMEGIVALGGEGVEDDADISGGQLFDVAPTVLATLGVPLSDRMDGTVLPGVEEPSTASYPRAERDSGLGDTDPEVEERLEAIGYL